MDHDFESTKLSQFLSTTFAYLSLNQALDDIVCYLLNRPADFSFIKHFTLDRWIILFDMVFNLLLSFSCRLLSLGFLPIEEQFDAVESEDNGCYEEKLLMGRRVL